MKRNDWRSGQYFGNCAVERRGDHRSRSMPRSYPYAVVDSAEDQRVRVYGLSERKEQLDDLPKMGQHEIQIQEPAILVQRLLRGHCHIFLWTLIYRESKILHPYLHSYVL